MNHITLRNLTILVLTIALGSVGLIACGEGGTDVARNAPEQQEASLPADLFAQQPLAETVTVLKTKESASKGDTVRFWGKIGGRVEPFTEGRAVMLVADDTVPFCTPDEGCPTPWDACCTPQEIKTKRSITVQVADDRGLPVAAGLNGKGNLKPGAVIEVEGTVHEASDGAFVVSAKKIHVKS